MFEKYTETARKAVFFARYEASNSSSAHIETEHLLLGVLRADVPLALRLLKDSGKLASIRERIEKQPLRTEKPSPVSTDLPLSRACKRVLAYGAEESERLNQKHIDAVHMLMGLLREEKCLA